MNIKLFAPGSKESRCPALPKSQGYSPNKQSYPSPEETHCLTHTLAFTRAVSEGEAGGGSPGVGAAVSSPWLHGEGVSWPTGSPDLSPLLVSQTHQARLPQASGV